MTEKIIIFAPHPDDEVLGCGGVSALKARAGAAIQVWFFTDGSMLLKAMVGIEDSPSPAEVSAIRKAESRKGAEILGVGSEHHYYMDYTDGTLSQHENEGVLRVVDILQQQQPDAVYYMNPYEGHPDHVASNRILRRACEKINYQGQRLQYLVNLKWDYEWKPEEHELLCVDISAVRELKRSAIEQNQSHLGLLSVKQDKAPWESIPDKFLAAEEIFIVDR